MGFGMQPIGPRLRLVAWRGATAVMLGLILTSMGLAADKSWNAGNGSWYTANNWTPLGVPVGNEFIRIGNLPGVQNSTVVLTSPGSGYDLLEISNGMTLDMNGGELVSFDDAFIAGAELAADRPACRRTEHARLSRRAACRGRRAF